MGTTLLRTPFAAHLRLVPPLSQNPNIPVRLSPPLLCRNRGRLRFRIRSAFSPAMEAESVGPESDAEDEGGGADKFDWYSQWYPVAPVCDLDKRRPHAKTVMDLNVVVWWDRNEGRWRVFDDSCPHRLAPLSEGRIDQQGRLQCVYHGWCFDGHGSCKFIPQEPPDGPKFHTFRKACASSYPSFEQNKIVWFWPTTDPNYKDISTQKKPPYIPELDDPSYASLLGNRDIPYGYEILIENLMDPAHVPYAHYGIMRFPQDKSKFRDREGGRPLDIKLLKLDKDGFIGSQQIGFSKFIAPCILYVSSDSPADHELFSAETVKQGQPADLKKQRRFVLIFICVPVSPGRSRLIWSFPRNFAVWMDKIIPRWIFHINQNLILDSDLYLLHLEEKRITEVGPLNWLKVCFVPTKSDALIVGFRRWLKKYSGGHVDWGSKFQTLLPPSVPREQLMDRYWSHVVHCKSCSRALGGLKALEVSLQVVSILSLGIVAVVRQNAMSTLSRSVVASAAVLFFLASRWLSHFIFKNFYYHDYDHAFK